MSLRQNLHVVVDTPPLSLVTSQNVTAPKRFVVFAVKSVGLVTSQNVTAPKLLLVNALICIV